MDNFQTFASALNKRLTTMSKNELYVVGDSLDKDSIWLTYLDSFPVGTNPMFRERCEHDCSTCRAFVKNLGNVVEIVNGEVRTIWEFAEQDSFYDEVADAMHEYVLSLPLTGLFRTSERTYGAQKTNALNATTGNVETWTHFYGRVADRHFTKEVGPTRSNFESAVQVLGRGLEEIVPSALETVVDLIDNNSLYRGEEHLPALTGFRTMHNRYWRYGKSERQAFVFANATKPEARFRNTVIGTLVQDLSSGVDLESAVRMFESKVAPTNYKRPKALITPAMVKSAMATINELGVELSLKRRHANIGDVSVNNVLWVNNDTQAEMKDGIEGLLLSAVERPTGRLKNGEPEPISIVQFMKDVLPGASSVDLMLRNDHEPNFVSITTADYPSAPNIFKWNNPFAWSYGGNVADSIKEKVKRAGGSVTGQLRVSLSWFNYDDLDIHVFEPNGSHIWYSNKQGKLDVDMNAGGRSSREPVENVSWSHNIQDGEYRIVVNQYSQRETVDVGFVIETESNGHLNHFSYNQVVRGDVEVGRMEVRNGVIVAFKPGKGISGGSISREIWGVKTEAFVPVKTVMYSPNHWDDDAVGNKHWFFILEGCLNPDPARGFYNEFLRSDLEKHRKVFEILGDRTKCEPVENQLSGVGFSSTAGAKVAARVMQGSRQRFIDIQF